MQQHKKQKVHTIDNNKMGNNQSVYLSGSCQFSLTGQCCSEDCSDATRGGCSGILALLNGA